MNGSKETNDRYYMRTVAGAQTVPHPLLAALFAYVSPPRLEFRAKFREINHQGPLVEMRLFNRGRSPARHPCVQLFGESPFNWLHPAPGGFSRSLRQTEDGRPFVELESTSDLVVYPESDAIVATVRLADNALSGRNAGATVTQGLVTLHFDLRAMCLNGPPIEGKAQLGWLQGEDPGDALQRRAVVPTENA